MVVNLDCFHDRERPSVADFARMASVHCPPEEIADAFKRAGFKDAERISKDKLAKLIKLVVPTLTQDQLDTALADLSSTHDVAYDQLMTWLYRDANDRQKATGATNSSKSSATLRIIQVTDVYVLDNFPSLRTLIQAKREELNASQGAGSKTISMLTGDFLMPYLLSTIDGGQGMMRMLNETPIDYLTWGNHEADLEHARTLHIEKEYKGTWINTNMTSHESYATSTSQRDHAIVEVKSADGTNVRRIGMIAVLSDEAGLYKKGAFGGAKIEDPWEKIAEYKRRLEQGGCDLVLPLCHLYEPQDDRTAREFDFPVILSGHDHHVVDRMHEGTRILKPGSDAINAIILDITWPDAAGQSPQIHHQLVKVSDWQPDPRLARLAKESYAVLDRLTKTQLTVVPDEFRPLTSIGTRSRLCSLCKFFCSEIRDALNLHCHTRTPHCQLVLINGGNFRGERDYSEEDHITLEALKSEMDEKVEICIAEVPGRVLKGALCETWNKPSGAWMQHCDSVKIDEHGFIESIDMAPLDLDRLYRVGTTTRFGIKLSPSISAYLEANPHHQPSPDVAFPAHALLMSIWAERVWVHIFDSIDADKDSKWSISDLSALDTDHNGGIDATELLDAIKNLAGMSVFKGENALVEVILEVAGDTDHDGLLTLQEVNAKRLERVMQLKRFRSNQRILASLKSATRLMGSSNSLPGSPH